MLESKVYYANFRPSEKRLFRVKQTSMKSQNNNVQKEDRKQLGLHKMFYGKREQIRIRMKPRIFV